MAQSHFLFLSCPLSPPKMAQYPHSMWDLNAQFVAYITSKPSLDSRVGRKWMLCEVEICLTHQGGELAHKKHIINTIHASPRVVDASEPDEKTEEQNKHGGK